MSEAVYKVFVYGTLKPGGHYWPQFCEGKVSEVLPAKVQGKLYDLHVGYPGVRFGGATWVQGYLLSIPSEADFLQLDVLEGFVPGRDPSKNEYDRRIIPCFAPDGSLLQAETWAYEMSEARITQMGGTQIEDGNWPI